MDYYGLQCTFLNHWNKGVVFVGGENRKINEPTNHPTSGNRVANEVILFGDTDEMVMGIDSSYDLGDKKYYATDGTKSIMVNSYTSKCYMYLISSKTQGGSSYFSFNTGDVLSFRGYYIFRPKTL